MGGRPVWLASASLWKRNTLVLTGEWSGARRSQVRGIIERVLENAGDPTRERGFRMNVTLCIHRAVSDDELAQLPADWSCIVGTHLAGGPIENLWFVGVADRLSTRPCQRPHRMPLGPTWVPTDCGACPPCLARQAMEARAGQSYCATPREA